jgi:hypothetical protein
LGLIRVVRQLDLTVETDTHDGRQARRKGFLVNDNCGGLKSILSGTAVFGDSAVFGYH